jgi:predicted Fe-Mo cluster-binding NifX family protein
MQTEVSMKICIPVEENNGLKSQVNGHFGSSPCFVIYDTDSHETETVDNGNAHHAHGMCHPLSMLNGKKIDAVICGGMGARAVMKLNEAGIKAFRSAGGTIEALILDLKNNTLEEITPSNACNHHDCHQ